MFQRERLLDIIKNFILFAGDSQNPIKILAGYHQYFAVRKAIEKATQEALEKGEEAQQALQEAIKKGTYNVRKWNLKNVGIAGGVLAAVIAGIALIKKSAQKKNEANFNAQVEEAKKLDEIKHQQELREIEQAQEIAAAKAGSAE